MNYSSSSHSSSLSDLNITTWEESVCVDGSLFYVEYCNKNAFSDSKHFVKSKKINPDCKSKNLQKTSCYVNKLMKLHIKKEISEYTKSSNLCLRNERISESTTNLYENQIMQISNFDGFFNLSQYLCKSTNDELNFSAIIVPVSFLCDELVSNEAIFSYPNKNSCNYLFKIRGCFLTLFSIFKSQLMLDPICTKVNIENSDYFVFYICKGSILLLISISAKCLTYKEAQLKFLEIVQYFQSTYQLFNKNIESELKTHLYQSCRIIDMHLQNIKSIYLFEEILQQSHLIHLPKKTQQEILETLNEMGAMDYRDWNNTPLNGHREFFIHGCALYFQSLLLNNQLFSNHLRQVESILRCSSLFNFIKTHTVYDFIYWKELPLENDNSRNFILICTRNNLTLAVLLRKYKIDNKIKDEKIRGPPLFYVEEIQETLDHLRHRGIEQLVEVWLKQFKQANVYPDDTFESFLSSEKYMQKTSQDTSILENSTREFSENNVMYCEPSKYYEIDADWDGFSNNHKHVYRDSNATVIEGTFPRESSPISICLGEKNAVIFYVHINFGSGIIIAPPYDFCDFMVQEFKSACHAIHKVFQNTKRLYKLSGAKKISKLSIVREHAIHIYVTAANGQKQKFWAIGKLLTSPLRELYICHKSEGPLNLEEIAFRLSFLNAG